MIVHDSWSPVSERPWAARSAALVVRSVVDGCLVQLVDGAGTPRWRTVALRDRGKAALARSLEILNLDPERPGLDWTALQRRRSALISHVSDPKQQGTVFGLFHMLGSLARVIGPLIATSVYTKHHTAPYLIAASMTLALALWSVGLRAIVVRELRLAHATT